MLELAAATASPKGELDPDQATLLVVDDEVDLLELLRDLLESQGYRVATATDGLAALALLRRGLRPHAILLDLMMPRMDGWDLRREQMSDSDLGQIPVIILTAAGFSESSVKTQLGDVGFVPKPFGDEDILAAIRLRCGEPHS
jgi:CheY-like chemotaxis protein